MDVGTNAERKSFAEAQDWMAGAALPGDALKLAWSQRQEEAEQTIADVVGFFFLFFEEK